VAIEALVRVVVSVGAAGQVEGRGGPNQLKAHQIGQSVSACSPLRATTVSSEMHLRMVSHAPSGSRAASLALAAIDSSATSSPIRPVSTPHGRMLLSARRALLWAVLGCMCCFGEERMDTFHFSVDRVLAIAELGPIVVCVVGADRELQSLQPLVERAATQSALSPASPLVLTHDGSNEWVRLRRHLDARFGVVHGTGHSENAWGEIAREQSGCALISQDCGCAQEPFVAPCSRPVVLRGDKPGQFQSELAEAIDNGLMRQRRQCPHSRPSVEATLADCWAVGLVPRERIHQLAFVAGLPTIDLPPTSPTYHEHVVRFASRLASEGCPPSVVLSEADTTPLFDKRHYPKDTA
jgi:hypothetical protein